VLTAAANTGFARVTGLPDFTGLVEAAGPAVVNIQVVKFGERVRDAESNRGDRNPNNSEQMPEFFRRFFDVPGNPGNNQPDRRGTGSGFIFEAEGPVKLFQILKDDAVKGLHSICKHIWKTQQWPQDWKRSVFIPITRKGNAKECSNYRTIALISYTSKVTLKILQARLQQYMNRELPNASWFWKRQRNQRSNCQHPLDHQKSKRIPEKHLFLLY